MIKLNLELDLLSILYSIPDTFEYQWRILEFEGIGENALALEEKAFRSTFGIKINFRELLNLEINFSQIINLILIGNSKSESKEECRELDKNDILIELVDSSYWEVSILDKEMEESISFKLSQFII